MTQCPVCGYDLVKGSMLDSQYQLVYCEFCDKIMLVDTFSDALCNKVVDFMNAIQTAIKEEIPPMEEGTPIYVNNKESKFFLDIGIVIDRDHLHYRVKLSNGTQVWMPEHWIRSLPKELRRHEN